MSTQFNSENGQAPAVWRRGANDGMFLGLWMSAIFICGAYSQNISLLAWLTLLMMAAVPVIVYGWLKRDWLKWPQMRFFSAAWMHGICIFFFGSLIMAAVIVIFMKFIRPDFILESVRRAIEIYRSLDDPEAANMAHTLQEMINRHMLPTPVNLGITMIWTVTFTGSILSMILTGMVKLTTRNK